MQTKLNQYSNGIMEAAWLAALILVPVFFNVYSSRIFEPDKIALLRTLALVTLAAWLVKLIEEVLAGRTQAANARSVFKFIIQTPLLFPVVSLAVVYLVATIFSIVPGTSFLGSYQRMQGTYTTFSYLVLFGAIAANLRQRSQVERIITVIVLTSLPVALYGVLQRFKIDPIPWGGDTSIRIASNMGNSIFVAAYIIMAFPLTVARIVESFRAILNRDEAHLAANFVRSTLYVFTAALQVIALYMSQSRGPALGWMAGSFFFFLLLSLIWRQRWLTLTTVGAAAALGVFLLVFNLEGGPLESLRASPAIGRFGLMLNAQSNSALVRKYIWQGAAELVAPHEPLQFPDERTDRWNFLRPVLGYGPESMYVAYNPFYVPELAYVERRNASPDRSHNETWDSLVITGVLGIAVYFALFVLIFYYGLKWIGMLNSARQRSLFFALSLGGGVAGALGFSLWRGTAYFGVGLPFGILIGLLLYLTAVALFAGYAPPHTLGEASRRITLAVLIAAIVAHFVEINFGIAIVSTRTYFWVYTALLFVVGHILPKVGQYQDSIVLDEQPAPNLAELARDRHAASRKKKRPARESDKPVGFFARPQVIAGLLTGLVLVTLGFDFINNPRNLSSAPEIIWASFTRLPNQNFAFSPGILLLVLTTWVAFSAVFSAEYVISKDAGSGLRMFGSVLGISAAAGLFYWLWQAGTLASMARFSAASLEDVLRQVGRYEGMLTSFYFFAFLLLFSLAVFLPAEWPTRSRFASTPGAGAGVVLLLAVIGLASYTNLRVIQADIVFKLAEPFSRSGQWPVAISIYNRANNLAPNEDYYYLFLGRAYLEQAKTLSDLAERDNLIAQASADLVKAQNISPLNTDHTANLARLYSLWASFETDRAEIERRGAQSEQYFATAVKLSPNNARIWDEWALLNLNVLGRQEPALEKITQALAIDPRYHWSYALLGEYHLRNARLGGTDEERQNSLSEAIASYTKALELPINDDPNARYNYTLALGNLSAQSGDLQAAINSYISALDLNRSPVDNWRIYQTIASLYLQAGDRDNALRYAQEALAAVPEDQKPQVEAFLNQIQQTQP